MSLELLKVEIIKKAWSDEEFKTSLLADPKNTIKSEFGVDFAPEIDLQVVEETPNRFYLTLPPSPEAVDDGTSSPEGVWS
jgi:hypothetical protein